MIKAADDALNCGERRLSIPCSWDSRCPLSYWLHDMCALYDRSTPLLHAALCSYCVAFTPRTLCPLSASVLDILHQAGEITGFFSEVIGAVRGRTAGQKPFEHYQHLL